jgi:hypothetical protein
MKKALSEGSTFDFMLCRFTELELLKYQQKDYEMIQNNVEYLLYNDEVCALDDGVHCLNATFARVRVKALDQAEDRINEIASSTLSGICILHGDDGYVEGFTYMIYDQSELEQLDRIRDFLLRLIRMLQVR